MSIFNDHLNPDQMRSDEDKIILEKYKVSNSGNTLIPRKEEHIDWIDWVKQWRYAKKAEKLPPGTFKEEKSIFKSMSIYSSLTESDRKRIYPKYEEFIRGMGLPCLVYNKKRYYQINREVKRRIISNILNK